MYFVYVIRSNKYARDYVGLTECLERRVREHNSGKTKSTRFYRPWRLLFFEEYETREEARKREKYLKSGYGKKWIKQKWPCLPK